MNVFFLAGLFFAIDGYAINDWLGLSVGTLPDGSALVDETINGGSSFNTAIFFAR